METKGTTMTTGNLGTGNLGTGNLGTGNPGSDMSSGVSRTVDQATTTAHRAIDKASEAARPTVDKLASGAHNLVDKLAGAATTAADSLDTKTGQLKDAQARLTESCREYVRENPLQSLGIALAAGFLLSRLMSSR